MQKKKKKKKRAKAKSTNKNKTCKREISYAAYIISKPSMKSKRERFASPRFLAQSKKVFRKKSFNA